MDRLEQGSNSEGNPPESFEARVSTEPSKLTDVEEQAVLSIIEQNSGSSVPNPEDPGQAAPSKPESEAIPPTLDQPEAIVDSGKKSTRKSSKEVRNLTKQKSNRLDQELLDLADRDRKLALGLVKPAIESKQVQVEEVEPKVAAPAVTGGTTRFVYPNRNTLKGTMKQLREKEDEGPLEFKRARELRNKLKKGYGLDVRFRPGDLSMDVAANADLHTKLLKELVDMANTLPKGFLEGKPSGSATKIQLLWTVPTA
jgi:hypothetical protein